MLHIHNGDSSANTLRQSAIPGPQFAFRESLLTGPTPAGIAGESWRRLRATHLAESYGVDSEECARALQRQDEMLAGLADHDEVIMWFEHDLFCQLNLIYLLDWFQGRDLGTTKFSLICIDRFPGVADFRGLGQLTAEQLASLFPTRHEITAAELKLASAAWEAYRSPDPRAIERLLREDTAALPFLGAALLAHLARFPSARNGLGRIENRGLELIDQGVGLFSDLFSSFAASESVYGLGDLQFWLALKQMGAAANPLVTFENGQGVNASIEFAKLRDTKIGLTVQGQSTLKGKADFVEMNGADEWLGGVHLLGNQVWRWDEASHQLFRS